MEVDLISGTNEESQISSYYKNKSIFISGGTGFLGKVLIEKLLRSCGQLKAIYVLIRVKKGKTPLQRLDEVLNSCGLFEKVKQIMPDYRNKLIPIEGDLMEIDLGISESDRSLLMENVNIVFHSAATVRFDEPMKVAVNINVVGTKKMLELSKTFKKLEAFVHVSTAYANCNQKYITEEVFKPPAMPKKLIEACEFLKDDVFKEITPKMIGNRQNTYTYTKAIAEYLVLQEANRMPCVIVRPSIVGACWLDPYKGWIDNYNAATGIFNAIQHGFVRCLYFKSASSSLNLIPVDVVINTTIVSAWHTGSNQLEHLRVYNCTQENTNLLTTYIFEKAVNNIIERTPCEKIFLVPKFTISYNKLYKWYSDIFHLMIPSYIGDLWLKMFKRKPYLLRLNNKINSTYDKMAFFADSNFDFTRNNYLALLMKMNEKDKQMFKLDTHSLDWQDYLESYFLGVRKHVEKEDLSNMQAKRNNYRRMKLKMNVCFYGMVIFVLKVLYFRSRLVRKTFTVFFEVIFFLIKNLKLYKALLNYFF